MNFNRLATIAALTSLFMIGCSSNSRVADENTTTDNTSAGVQRLPVTPTSASRGIPNIPDQHAINADPLPPGLDHLPIPPMPGAETGNINGSFGLPKIPDHKTNILLPKNPIGKDSGFQAPPQLPISPFGNDGVPSFPGLNKDGRPISGFEADGVPRPATRN